MIIYVVQPGDTIDSIAERYSVPVARLIEENAIFNPDDLVVGQTIVITNPLETYTVQDGDSLMSIAETYGVTMLQLLRNNPNLFNRNFIYPGESIVISYETGSKISTNGFAYPFIDIETLKKTLPYLTYLTIFNYRSIEGGEIIGEDDTEIIQIAKDYSVAPIMLLSTLTYLGTGNLEVVDSILNNLELQNKHIDNILRILRTKEYYGLNISIVHLNEENRPLYENFITNLSNRLSIGGFLLIVTITPRISIGINEVTIEKLDYSELAQVTNNLLFLSYGWGYAVGPPTATTPVYLVRDILDYVVSSISTEKISIGLSTIGYDWQLPYIIGISRANSLTTDAAIALALEVGAIILFDEDSKAPYYEYVDYSSVLPINHVVWFKDARSVDALVKLIPEYGLDGVGIWNIMSYFAQMWLVINSQYEIEKVIPEY